MNQRTIEGIEVPPEVLAFARESRSRCTWQG
jgi:hypothetical protein